MGKYFMDFWTIIHFASGFVSCSALLPTHPVTCVLIVNTIHAFMEYVENNKMGDIVLESQVNHVCDILAFFIGSLIGAIWGRKFFLDEKGGIRYNVL